MSTVVKIKKIYIKTYQLTLIKFHILKISKVYREIHIITIIMNIGRIADLIYLYIKYIEFKWCYMLYKKQTANLELLL